jgi:hypothetical protein
MGRNTTGLSGVYCQRNFHQRIPSVTTIAEKLMDFLGYANVVPHRSEFKK